VEVDPVPVGRRKSTKQNRGRGKLGKERDMERIKLDREVPPKKSRDSDRPLRPKRWGQKVRKWQKKVEKRNSREAKKNRAKRRSIGEEKG